MCVRNQVNISSVDDQVLTIDTFIIKGLEHIGPKCDKMNIILSKQIVQKIVHHNNVIWSLSLLKDLNMEKHYGGMVVYLLWDHRKILSF